MALGPPWMVRMPGYVFSVSDGSKPTGGITKPSSSSPSWVKVKWRMGLTSFSFKQRAVKSVKHVSFPFSRL